MLRPVICPALLVGSNPPRIIRRHMVKLLFVQGLLLLALTPPAIPASVEARRVTFSYSAVSMTWFPVKVALEKGFFRNEAIEPQLIQMNGNVATVALANGHIDFALNISPVLNGAMQGQIGRAS